MHDQEEVEKLRQLINLQKKMDNKNNLLLQMGQINIASDAGGCGTSSPSSVFGGSLRKRIAMESMSKEELHLNKQLL